MKALMILTAGGLLISCGVVGSPVPPEFVGVAPTIEKQNRQRALEGAHVSAERPAVDPSLEGHDLDLPPSHPVGTR